MNQKVDLHLKSVNYIRTNTLSVGRNGILHRTTVPHPFHHETGFYVLQSDIYEVIFEEDVGNIDNVMTYPDLLMNGAVLHNQIYRKPDGSTAGLLTINRGAARFAPTVTVGYFVREEVEIVPYISPDISPDGTNIPDYSHMNPITGIALSIRPQLVTEPTPKRNPRAPKHSNKGKVYKKIEGELAPLPEGAKRTKGRPKKSEYIA